MEPVTGSSRASAANTTAFSERDGYRRRASKNAIIASPCVTSGTPSSADTA